MGTFCIWTDDLIASLIGICANTLWSCLGSPPPSHLYPNPSLLHIEFPRAFLVACPAVCTLICRHQPGCCLTWGAPSALCFQSFCPDGISSALLSQQRACVQKRRKTGGSSGNPTFHGRCVTPAWTIARQQWLCVLCFPFAAAGDPGGALSTDILTVALGRQKEESPYWCEITATHVKTTPSSRTISRRADQYVLCRPGEQSGSGS